MEANFHRVPDIRRRVNYFFQEKLTNITRPISDPMHVFSDEDTIQAIEYFLMCYSMGILTQEAADLFDKIVVHKIGLGYDELQKLIIRYGWNKGKRESNQPVTDPLTPDEEHMVVNWHRYFFHHKATKNETPFG